MDIQFSHTICWRDCLFSSEKSWHLLTNHWPICMRVYLWTLFSNQLVFMPTPHSFEYYRFVVSFEIRKCYSISFVILISLLKKEGIYSSFFSIFSVSTIWDSLRFRINFRMGFSIPAKKKKILHLDFDIEFIESVDCFL